jgi:hypothetical protein
MGIDLYFSDESLENCRYALCRKLRTRPVQVSYSDEGTEKEWWQYRKIRRTSYLDKDISIPEGKHDYAYEYRMNRKPEEEPDEIVESLSGTFKIFSSGNDYQKEFLRWVSREEFESLAREYENKPDSKKGWVEHIWREGMPWEKAMLVCSKCPVAPIDEESCNIRFSNYPSMNYFKGGLLATILLGAKYTAKDLEQNIFSFPNLDRKKGETPGDKIEELWNYCADAEINRTGEETFNKLSEMLKEYAGSEDEDTKIEGAGKIIELAELPLVDIFLSKCVYRDEHYNREEANKLVPMLETLYETADWVRDDLESITISRLVESFQWRLNQLLKGLRTARKYDLELCVSY